MKVRTAALWILFLAFFCTQALAESAQARYRVTDMVDQTYNRTETWVMSALMEKGSKIYKLTKSTPAKDRAQETEIIRTWFVEVRNAGKPTYWKEVLSLHPREMDVGERSFGYIEERDVADDSVIKNWPLFCRIEKIAGGRRATFTAYLAGNLILQVVRDYEESETYYFPISESRVLMRGDEVQSHLIYAREK